MALAKDMFDGDGVAFDKESWDYLKEIFNIDNKFSADNQLIREILPNIGLMKMANPNQKPDPQEGLGKLGKLLGGGFTNPIHSYFKAHYILTKGKPPFEVPTNLKYGLLGEGFLEDVGATKALGISNNGVTGLKGIGGSKVAVLSELGITTKEQLEEYVKKNGFGELKMKVVSAKAKKGFYMRKVFSSADSVNLTTQWANEKK